MTLTVEAKNKALDSLADDPVGSGVVLSAYGFAATMKAQAQQKEAEEKAKEKAKPKAAVVVSRPLLLQKRPLPSRRQLLLPSNNPAAASEGLEDDDDDDDKENARDAYEGSYEGAADMKVGEEEGKEEENNNNDDRDGDGDAAAPAAGIMNMISCAASKFRVAGLSRRRRLE